jgi:hypothetical protein
MNGTMNPSAMMPTGILMKNNQCHDRLSVMYPPANGPTIDARPNTAPIAPWYLPRSRGAMMSPMIAWDSGIIVPMPNPSMTRAIMNVSKLCASPAITDAVMKVTTPPT